MRFDKRSRKLRTKRRKGKRSFPTSFLLYLFAGLVVLAIFLFVVYSGHERQLSRLRQEKIHGDMETISSALLAYYQTHGHYPTAEQGLQALVSFSTPRGIPVSETPSGYLDRVPLDPWGNPYQYKILNPVGPFDLICLGSDGRSGGTGEAADVGWK